MKCKDRSGVSTELPPPPPPHSLSTAVNKHLLDNKLTCWLWKTQTALCLFYDKELDYESRYYLSITVRHILIPDDQKYGANCLTVERGGTCQLWKQTGKSYTEDKRHYNNVIDLVFLIFFRILFLSHARFLLHVKCYTFYVRTNP